MKTWRTVHTSGFTQSFYRSGDRADRGRKPHPLFGTKIVDTGQPFDAFVKKLTAVNKANKMGIVGIACATCGAKSIGVTIPGNRVMMIFNPHFAVRMLKASETFRIEAPLRLYITERPDGNVFEDRDLDIVSILENSVEDRIKQLDRALSEGKS